MTDSCFLAGRAALVTGAAGGLGACMARALVAAGADVMMSDIVPPETGSAARLELATRFGRKVHYHQADIANRRELGRLIDATLTAFGSVEILVNNAVVRHFAPIETFPMEDWDQALAVNLTAAFYAIRRLVPVMRTAGYGRIFNMTSVYGSRATTKRVDYVTTKTALQGLTRATALELADDPISCHALTPGVVQTPGVQWRIDKLVNEEGLSAEEAQNRFLAGKQPNGRFVNPASITAVMLLLCGPTGLDMNGAILPVEGGWLAHS